MSGIHDSCRKIFGTWNKAIAAAGLVPHRSHDDRMYKRIITKSIDGHLCDSLSEVLVDNWLYENRVTHKKNAPYPNTHHKADWQIFCGNKPIFIEYFGLANDSPRYDRSITKKKVLCRNENICLVAIYPKDLYPKSYRDSNLRNKFKDYLSI